MISGTSVERYEIDIVDKLRSYEKDGKGKLLELCNVEVGGRQLPFVAFTTGEQVVVTARHHIDEFWGPTETVMKLAESGQEGLTLVPVVDVEYYAESEGRKEFFVQEESRRWAAACMSDILVGYKDCPPSNAKHQWQDYRYRSEDPPAYIAAIKRLIDQSQLFFDLHNWSERVFYFLTHPIGTGSDIDHFQHLAEGIEEKGQRVKNGGYCLAPGLYRHSGSDTSIDYAGYKGKMNLGIEIPIFDYRTSVPGKYDELYDVQELTDVTSAVITRLVRAI